MQLGKTNKCLSMLFVKVSLLPKDRVSTNILITQQTKLHFTSQNEKERIVFKITWSFVLLDYLPFTLSQKALWRQKQNNHIDRCKHMQVSVLNCRFLWSPKSLQGRRLKGERWEVGDASMSAITQCLSHENLASIYLKFPIKYFYQSLYIFLLNTWF